MRGNCAIVRSSSVFGPIFAISPPCMRSGNNSDKTLDKTIPREKTTETTKIHYDDSTAEERSASQQSPMSPSISSNAYPKILCSFVRCGFK